MKQQAKAQRESGPPFPPEKYMPRPIKQGEVTEGGIGRKEEKEGEGQKERKSSRTKQNELKHPRAVAAEALDGLLPVHVHCTNITPRTGSALRHAQFKYDVSSRSFALSRTRLAPSTATNTCRIAWIEVCAKSS
jgi:hypothetical protein